MRRRPDTKRISIAALGVVFPLVLCSCYLTTQTAGYLSIRARAVPVSRILADPATEPRTRAFLERAQAVRAFAQESIGLKRTKSYTSFVQLESDRLATVVSACAELSFDRYLWSYPFVGKLPYRGYFDPKEAEVEAARLRAEHLDVIVRPVDAFSTLGILSDPLFSFMVDYDEADVAELVIHEMTHATVFAKGANGAEQFNEELATFVGRTGALLWLAAIHGPSSTEVETAKRDRADAEAFAAWLRGTAEELDKLYDGPLSDQEKRDRKAAVIADRAREYKEKYDELFSTEAYRSFPMERLNNAYLDLYRLYEGEPELYRDYFEERCAGDLRRFVQAAARIVREAKGRDPKDAMRAELQ